jgi:hypothetical protein
MIIKHFSFSEVRDIFYRNQLDHYVFISEELILVSEFSIGQFFLMAYPSLTKFTWNIQVPFDVEVGNVRTLIFLEFICEIFSITHN